MEIDKFEDYDIAITSNKFVRINYEDISLDEPIVKYYLMLYKSLMLSENTNNLYEHIPDYIIKLSLNLIDYRNLNFNKLHVNLKELYILAEANRSYGDGDFDKSLDNLPLNLEILCIQSARFNQSIDNLPSGLKKLCIQSDCFNQSLDNLPSSLEYLQLTKYINKHIQCEFDFNNLPINLKTLCILYDINQYAMLHNRYPKLTITKQINYF